MQAPSSLCPGFTYVESFGPDEEYESEEEVCYVTLDLGDVEPQLVPSSNSYRLIGLDTPTPYLQLHGTIMKGRHDMLLGTELIFTDDKDGHDRNNRHITHVGNTEQRIAFEEVTLIPKIKSDGKGADSDITVNFDPPKTSDDARQIETLTGVTAPTRAPRQRKSSTKSSGSASKSRAKGKGKANAQSARSAVKRGAKGKGKQKAHEDSDEDDEAYQEASAMAEDGVGDNDLDDMYMEE